MPVVLRERPMSPQELKELSLYDLYVELALQRPGHQTRRKTGANLPHGRFRD